MRVLGLARTPRRVAESLSATAAGAADAAAELAALGRGRSDADAVAQAAREARLRWRAALGEAGEMLSGGIDRSDIVDMALSLKDVADSVDEAAAAVQSVPPRAVPLAELTSVIRDSARALAGAVERLDGPARERDLHLERVEVLHDEGSGLVRRARADLLTREADTLASVSGDEALRRLERALRACRCSGQTVRRVVVKHA